MKTFNFLLLVVILFIASSCDTLDKFTQFNLNFTQKITIEASTPVNFPFNFPTPPISSNSENVFKTNNTNKNLVEEITLTKLQLKIISPNEEDFSLLKSIEVYISSDELEDVKIAWLNTVPENESIITLEVSDKDLKDFIFADSFSLKVKTVTDEVNTRDYEIEIKSTFKVNAKLLGI